MGGGLGGQHKNAISPFVDDSGEKILVLVSALVERFGVSRMWDFYVIFKDFYQSWAASASAYGGFIFDQA